MCVCVCVCVCVCEVEVCVCACVTDSQPPDSLGSEVSKKLLHEIRSELPLQEHS